MVKDGRYFWLVFIYLFQSWENQLAQYSLKRHPNNVFVPERPPPNSNAFPPKRNRSQPTTAAPINPSDQIGRVDPLCSHHMLFLSCFSGFYIKIARFPHGNGVVLLYSCFPACHLYAAPAARWLLSLFFVYRIRNCIGAWAQGGGVLQPMRR